MAWVRRRKSGRYFFAGGTAEEGAGEEGVEDTGKEGAAETGEETAEAETDVRELPGLPEDDTPPEAKKLSVRDPRRISAGMVYAYRASSFLQGGMHPEAAADYEKYLLGLASAKRARKRQARQWRSA